MKQHNDFGTAVAVFKTAAIAILPTLPTEGNQHNSRRHRQLRRVESVSWMPCDIRKVTPESYRSRYTAAGYAIATRVSA